MPADGPGPEAKHLGELELAVMDVLWAREQATVRDVLQALNVKRSLAYTTVMTVMNRLWGKGILQRRLEGKTHIYHAAVSREGFQSEISRRQVRTLVEDFGDVALAHFAVEIGRGDPARLQKLLDLARRAKEEPQS